MDALRKLLPSDSQTILNWRNSADVAPFMYDDERIGVDQHAVWFEAAIKDSAHHRHRVIMDGGVDIGLCSFTKINERHKSCEWGGYLAPSIPRGSGVGKSLLSISLRFAFEELHMHRVQIEVLTTNVRAIALYDSFGLTREGTLRHRALHKDQWQDAHVYSFLIDEWKNIS